MWQSIKAFFKNSETIAWAWLNTVVGGAATAISFVDPVLIEPLLTPQVFAIYVLVNGLATKWLRERRDPDLGNDPGNDPDIPFQGENV